MQAVVARLSELRWERSLDGGDASRRYSTSIRQRLAELAPATRQSRARAHSYAGVTVSALLHVIVLGQLSYILLPVEAPKLLESLQAMLSPTPPKPEAIEPELTMADPSDEEAESVWAATANAIGPQLADNPDIAEDVEKIEAPDVVVDVPPVQEIAAAQLSEVVVRKGTIGDSVVEVSGAVDRITHEIATSLEQSKVLVVWLMDSSISLVDDREEVAARLDKVYREIDELGTLKSESLLGAVIAYGAQWHEIVGPTANGHDIVEGIRSKVPIDDSGIENVFNAVLGSLQRYRALKARERRKIMLVVWTDESGDDNSELEPALRECQRLAAPVFVVGPSSMFGRVMGTHAYKHPDDGKVYDIPVNRGPDTVRQELLRMPYWFAGNQFESLRAGVGPYALTRLSQETGGAYFVSEQKADRSPFSLATMRPYLPDYSSAQEYVQMASGSSLRRAILQAVEVTYQRELRGTPQLSFAPTGANFQQELREAQQTVAFNALILDQALAFFGPKGMEKEYAAEPSPRWKAWYDLTYGRLLAMRVRTNEYNWACAVMRGKGAEFVDKQSNRWTFRPDEKINFGSAAERTADEARRLLQRCIDQNPGTPWAVLAARELDHPFGFRVDEDYVPPPPEPKPDLTPNNNNPPSGRVVEQPRMLERPPEVKLPKL